MTRQKINEKVEKIIQKALVNDRFSLYMFDCVKDIIFDPSRTEEQAETVFDMLEFWDENSHIPYETGRLLNELEQDDTIEPAIHRTYFRYEPINGYQHNEDLEDIMCNGLINYGHANAVGGAAFLNKEPDVALTMTPFRGITGIINLAGSYKGNNTTIIAAFPKSIVDEDLYNKNNKENEIYDHHGKFNYIKPKYILGALIKNKNDLDTFYLKSEILENRYNLGNKKTS